MKVSVSNSLQSSTRCLPVGLGTNKKAFPTGKAWVGGKLLAVVMDGIEPPTQGFSVLFRLVSYGLIWRYLYDYQQVIK
jgi:hypothetical protein